MESGSIEQKTFAGEPCRPCGMVGKGPAQSLSDEGAESFCGLVDEKQRKDFEHELFGPVIFSYTDAQAIEDGVLYDVSHLTQHCVNRVTNAVYGFLGGFEENADVALGYRDLENTARAAFDKMKDKTLVEFDYKGKRFWMMDNETGARTIMFPEEY